MYPQEEERRETDEWNTCHIMPHRQVRARGKLVKTSGIAEIWSAANHDVISARPAAGVRWTSSTFPIHVRAQTEKSPMWHIRAYKPNFPYKLPIHSYGF